MVMPTVWVFLGLMLLIVGMLGFVIWRIRSLRRSVAAARTWPSVRGRVVHTEIRQSRIYLPKGGRAVLYHAVLVYEYAVGGRLFRHENFNVDGPQMFSSGAQAQQHLEKNAPGTAVTVYYDSYRPERAVLAHKAQRLGSLWFVLGVLVVMAVGVFSFFAFTPGMLGPGRWIAL
jgi:hypothetical protein